MSRRIQWPRCRKELWVCFSVCGGLRDGRKRTCERGARESEEYGGFHGDGLNCVYFEIFVEVIDVQIIKVSVEESPEEQKSSERNWHSQTKERIPLG